MNKNFLLEKNMKKGVQGMKKLIVIMVFMFSFIAYSNEREEKRITIITTQKSTIANIFEMVQKEYGVFFNFNKDIDLTQIADVKYKNVSLEETMYLIASQFNLKIERITESMYLVSIDTTAGTRRAEKEEMKITKKFQLGHNNASFVNFLSKFYKNIDIVEINNEIVVRGNYDIMNQAEMFAKDFSKVERKLQFHKLEYIKAEEVLKILKEAAIIKYSVIDSKNNILMMEYDDIYKEMIEKIIKEADKAEETLFIEMLIVDKQISRSDVIGVDYPEQFNVTRSFKDFTGEELFPVGVEAKNTFSTAKILSQPKVFTTNNKNATVHIGDKFPLVSSEEIEDEEGTVTKKDKVEYVDTGIVLNFLPVIKDETIALTMDMEIKTVNGYITGGYGSYPLFKNKKIKNEINLIGSCKM